VGSEVEAAGALPRRTRLLLGALGFAVAAAVAAPVTVATGASTPLPSASPTAGALPTGFAVGVAGVVPADYDATTLQVTLQNEGAAFSVRQVRLAGVGYEAQELLGLGGVSGLGVGDIGVLPVPLRPTCEAGLGVPRRPELVLEVRGHEGPPQVVRTELTAADGVPEVLLGRCEAPLATGARVTAALVPQRAGADVRVRVTLQAGPGLLWVDSLESRGGLSSSAPEGFPVVVAPGGRRTVDLVVSVSQCTDLAEGADPLAALVRLRPEPGREAPTFTLADLAGPGYGREVRALVARGCP
jgi:hypothetical protein